MISETDLILKNDNIYHLDVNQNNIGKIILLVGDQDRVAKISKHFDTITHRSQHREFVIHTGRYKGKLISAVSTGIGCDNIDIVINELDAIFNIDLKTRKVKKDFTQLTFVRLGTCGSISADIPVDSIVVSDYGLGLDNLMSFYKGGEDFYDNSYGISYHMLGSRLCYIVEGDKGLREQFSEFHHGITATFPGFYAPQGRNLRIQNSTNFLIDGLSKVEYNDLKVINFEMETSALYGLSKLMGHKALTLCTVVANRVTKEFTNDGEKSVNNLIQTFLDKIPEPICLNQKV